MMSHDRLRDAVDGRLRAGGQAALLAGADLYLIGSRTLGFATEFSDVDVVAFADIDWGNADISFTMDGQAPLEVSVAVVGPAGCAAREQAGRLAGWAFDLAHAKLLHAGTGNGEAYRAHVARCWARRRPVAATEARSALDVQLRQGQGAVRHRQAVAAWLTMALALHSAMRLIVISHGPGLPSDKWLPVVASRYPDGAAVVGLAEEARAAGPSLDHIDGQFDRLAEIAGRIPSR